MKPLSNEHKILVATLSSLVTMECMDEMQGMQMYRHELKQTGNRFLKELTKLTDEVVPLIWGIEDKTMYMVMDYYKALYQLIATMKPEDADAWRLPKEDRAKLRSKTFQGIAQAMAEQWG